MNHWYAAQAGWRLARYRNEMRDRMCL